MTFNLACWMGTLGPEKINSPLISLAIPGSHDSMTYTITPQSPVSPDSDKVIERLVHYCGFIVRPIVYSWCVTQTKNVLEQLALGIRYFDIRVATKVGTKDYFIVHGLYGEKVNVVFKDISNFLKENKTEIVILDMQHFHQFTEEDHHKYIAILKKLFPNMLCPCPNNVASISLHSMRQNGHQVIVIYRDVYADREQSVWNSRTWPTPWPQTMSSNDLLKFLNSRLHNRPKQCGFVSQCVLTPTNITVLKSPFSGIKAKCAIPACKTTIPWLKEQAVGLLNVAIADFVHINDAVFPNTVVSLNYTNKRKDSLVK